MGVEISDQVWGVTGQLCPFSFSGAVRASFVGVSGFEVYFDDSYDYPIKDLSLAVLVQASAGESVSATGTLHMSNGGNNQVNPWSKVIMTTLAWVGENPSKSVVFAPRNGIQVPSDSPEIQVGGTAPAVAASALTGFDLVYADEHCVHQLTLVTGQTVSTDENIARLNVDATLLDASGNGATTKSVSAGFLGFLPSAGVEAQVITVTDSAKRAEPIAVTFSKPVKSAAALLSGFDLSRTDHNDMNVSKIVVRTFADIKGKGATVNVDGWARITGHEADSDVLEGSMTVLVLATF